MLLVVNRASFSCFISRKAELDIETRLLVPSTIYDI